MATLCMIKAAGLQAVAPSCQLKATKLDCSASASYAVASAPRLKIILAGRVTLCRCSPKGQGPSEGGASWEAADKAEKNSEALNLNLQVTAEGSAQKSPLGADLTQPGLCSEASNTMGCTSLFQMNINVENALGTVRGVGYIDRPRSDGIPRTLWIHRISLTQQWIESNIRYSPDCHEFFDDVYTQYSIACIQHEIPYLHTSQFSTLLFEHWSNQHTDVKRKRAMNEGFEKTCFTNIRLASRYHTGYETDLKTSPPFIVGMQDPLPPCTIH